MLGWVMGMGGGVGVGRRGGPVMTSNIGSKMADRSTRMDRTDGSAPN